MSSTTRLRSYLYGSVAFGAMSLATTGAFAASCQGPGAPTTTQTKCLTAITIPGNPLQSFDISWVNPDRAEYYLADRANKGIDVIDTKTLTFKRTIGGFVGIVASSPTAIDNNHSGPDGVDDPRPLALCRRRRQHAQGVRPRDSAATADHQHRRHHAPRRNGADHRRQAAARRQQRRGSAVRDPVQGERRQCAAKQRLDHLQDHVID